MSYMSSDYELALTKLRTISTNQLSGLHFSTPLYYSCREISFKDRNFLAKKSAFPAIQYP